MAVMTQWSAGAAHDVQDDPAAAGHPDHHTPSPAGRRPGRLSQRQPLWTNRERTVCTSAGLAEGTCRVEVVGSLDAAALQPFRAALDAAHELALGHGLSHVVVDLSRATTSSPVSLALLSAGRRYLRHRGLLTVLLDVPGPLGAALRSAHVDSLYDFLWTSQEPAPERPDGPAAGATGGSVRPG